MTLLPQLSPKHLFLDACRQVRGGSLRLIEGGEQWRFGEPGGLAGAIEVHHPRFYRRALFGGDTGLGEAWMDGDWSSPDLVAVIRLAVRSLAGLERANRLVSGLSRLLDLLRHRWRANTVSGSRRNIHSHYDLSNEFFELFLDAGMMYSCACFEHPAETLEAAQRHKLELICRKLRLGPEDQVLEIGAGWGGFATYAAERYGCRVTTTTISREQHDYARRRFAASPAAGRITLLEQDYRHLAGSYDKLVSIEMFEAVGLRYYDEFFRACDRLLRPDGVMLLQTITINEQTFPAYRRRSDWIQKHIFPGGELSSVSEILRSLARATALSLYHAEEIGTHYARTLAAWRERFHAALPRVRALGFDERFVRAWDYYLAYSEGAFLERHVGDMQLVLAKHHNRRVLYNEPWQQQPAAAPTRRLAGIR